MSRVLKVLDEILYKYEGIPPQGFDDGGLATPKRGLVDGPGSYSQKKVIGANQATGVLVDIDLFNTVVDDYEKLVQSDFNKGDLSKIDTFAEYSKKRLPKRWKQLVGSIQRKNVRNPKNILFDKKNELLRKLIKQANDGERYVSQLDILKKVSDVPVRKEIGREGQLKARGFQDLGQWVDKDLPKLEPREKKVMRVFNDIIKNDPILELKDPNWKFIKTAKTGEEYKTNLLSKIIGERANVNSVNIVTDTISKHPEMKKKKFNEIFKYMTRAHVDDFEGYKFSDAFDYASERRGGASKFKNVDTMKMYKNPDVNIMNYALRHWDGNNFNELKSRIEFFDKKTGKPIKWKSGLRLNPQNVYFTLDGDPMQWDTRSLKTQGKQSGLFNDVYRTTNEFQRLKEKLVPDGKGGTKPFGEVIGKANLAIGHNAKGGVKASPFKNLQIQTQKMNTALFSATKHIKNKDLQKRVIREIYGGLYNVTGDEYLKKFLSNPPDVDYKEAGKRIIMNPKIDITRFSPAKQQELLRIATGKRIGSFKEKLKANPNLVRDLLEDLCPNKASGGRVGMKVAGSVGVKCGADRFKQVFKDPSKGTQTERQLVGRILRTSGSAAGRKALYALGPAGIGIDALVEGAIWGDEVLRGASGTEAYNNLWISYLDPTSYTGGLKVSGDRYNETEIAKTYGGDTAKFYKLAHAIEDKYRLENKLQMNEEMDVEGTGIILTPNQQNRLEEANTIIENAGGEETAYSLLKEDSPLFKAAQISSERFEEVGPGKDWDRKMLAKGPLAQIRRDQERKKEMDLYPTYDMFITPSEYKAMDLEQQREAKNVIPELNLTERANIKDIYDIPASDNLSEYVYPDTGKSIFDEENLIKKWNYLIDTKGMRGTQDTRYAGGGIAGIRRPHAIPPKSGPMPQGGGLSSMFNRARKW